jgi:hypothetical protein
VVIKVVAGYVVLGGSSENAQRQYAGDEEDLLLQYAIRQSLDTDTTASEQVERLPFWIIIQPYRVPGFIKSISETKILMTKNQKMLYGYLFPFLMTFSFKREHPEFHRLPRCGSNAVMGLKTLNLNTAMQSLR